MLRISLYSILNSTGKKMLYLPYYVCVFSSIKLVIRAEQDLLGTEGGVGGEGGEGRGGGRVEKGPKQCLHM
jgi:hypothetical protein